MRVWIPAQEHQISLIHRLTDAVDMTDSDLNECIQRLTSLPDINALSNREANRLVLSLKTAVLEAGGNLMEFITRVNRGAGEAGQRINYREQPMKGHIQQIRKAFHRLSWSPEEYYSYMKKYTGAGAFGELKRKQAERLCVMVKTKAQDKRPNEKGLSFRRFDCEFYENCLTDAAQSNTDTACLICRCYVKRKTLFPDLDVSGSMELLGAAFMGSSSTADYPSDLPVHPNE